jgi:hypothetical protein
MRGPDAKLSHRALTSPVWRTLLTYAPPAWSNRRAAPFDGASPVRTSSSISSISPASSPLRQRKCYPRNRDGNVPCPPQIE